VQPEEAAAMSSDAGFVKSVHKGRSASSLKFAHAFLLHFQRRPEPSQTPAKPAAGMGFPLKWDLMV
jgi:hypothetical protein